MGGAVMTGDGVAEDEQPVTMAATTTPIVRASWCPRWDSSFSMEATVSDAPRLSSVRGGGGLPKNGSGAAALKSRWLPRRRQACIRSTSPR